MQRLVFVSIACLFLLFAVNSATAQVCGEQDFLYVFVLHPHLEKDTAVVKNLTISLVDQNDKAYTRQVLSGVHEFESAVWQEVPLEFVFNEDEKVIAGIGENYYIVINSHLPANKAPVYIAKLSYRGQTIRVRLNLKQSLNVCANHLFDNKRERRNVKQLKQVDGKKFHAIDLNLQNPIVEKPLTKPLTRLIYRYDYDTLAGTKSIETKITLAKVEVLDFESLQLVQTIKPSKRHYFYATHLKESVMERNVMARRPVPAISDLVIITGEEYHGKEYFPEIHRDYWLWDSLQQRYIRNAMLSDYANIILTDSVPIRYWISEDKENKYVDFYSLHANAWRPYRHKVERKPPPPPVQHPLAGKNCVLLQQNYFLLPVQCPTDANAYYVSVRDSFAITNHCNEAVVLEELRSAEQKAFLLGKRWAAHETNYLSYNDQVAVNPNGIYKVDRHLYLKTASDYGQSLTYEFYVAGANTKRYDSTNSRIAYYEMYEVDSLSLMRLYVDEKGRAISYGRVLRSKGRKVGQWVYYQYSNQTQAEQQTAQYDKLLQFMFLHDRIGSTKVDLKNKELLKVEVLQQAIDGRSQWVSLPYALNQTVFNTYVDSSARAIRFSYGTDLTAEFRFNFEKLSNRHIVNLQWVKEGQFNYYTGGLKTPIPFRKGEYALLWNSEYLQQQKNSTYETVLSQEWQRLQQKYPMFRMCIDGSRHSFTYHLIANHFDSFKVAHAVNNLLKEPSVRALTLMIGEDSMNCWYADPSIYVQVNYNMRSEVAEALIKKYHFEAVRADGYASNYYHARYYKSLLDAEFLRDFKLLSEEPSVESINLNMYLQIEIDEGPMPGHMFKD